jgi:di/tricarboxylate transporter
MKEFLKKTADFFRAETVLSVAIILAFISAFFVHPDKLYISYINWRVLAILTGLILVMEGYKHLGIFSDIAGFLIRHVKNDTGICMMLIGLCFFFSMFLTNDVALITFVPLTIELMTTSGKKHYLIPVTVM